MTAPPVHFNIKIPLRGLWVWRITSFPYPTIEGIFLGTHCGSRSDESYSEKLTCQLSLLTGLCEGTEVCSEEGGCKSSSPPWKGSSGVVLGGVSADGSKAKFVWEQTSLTGIVWGSVGCNEEDRNLPAVLVGGAHACTLDGCADKPCGSAVITTVFGGRDVGFVTTSAISVGAIT